MRSTTEQIYDFERVIDRRTSNSLKWVHGRHGLTPEQRDADPLPMWVADMDFRVAEPILNALQREIDVGVLGYGGLSDTYLEAVCDWQSRRFGWEVQTEWVTQTPGVVCALNMAIQAFSRPGDYIAVQTPVYYHIHADVQTNGRRLIEVPLDCSSGRYRFDADAFEAALLPGTTIFILCNPHNPTGNVWGEDDLACMAEICERRGILVVSDEVHQDLVFEDGLRHIPFGSLDNQAARDAIVCTGPGKTFNVAGLACANVFIQNSSLRAAFRRQCERCGVGHATSLGTVACEVAYRECEGWVDAMIAYVGANHRHLTKSVAELGLPLSVTPSGSLYLAWIDFSRLEMEPEQLHDFLLRRARLWLDPGSKFGDLGAGYMRMNLGCPRAQVDEALTRLSAALSN